MPIFSLYLNTQTRFPEPPRLGFILVEGLSTLPLPLHASVLLTCTVSSLPRASCLFSRSRPHFTIPQSFVYLFSLFPYPMASPSVIMQMKRYGVGFHSSRPSTDPSVGSPPLPGPLHWCLVPLHSSQLPFLFRCVA